MAMAALALALAGAPAHAFLMPVRNVVRKVNARLAGAHSIHVTLVGRAREGDAPDQGLSVAERWIFERAKHAVRVDSNGPDGRTAAWSRGGSTSGDAALLPSAPERIVFSRLFG